MVSGISPQDIDAYIASIEHEYGVRIIGAWNNGSQAWGLASERSDWDFSFLYTQPLTNYATNAYYVESIDGCGEDLNTVSTRTNIPPEQIEFIGWDAKRFLHLCGENNPSALESLNTPEAYRTHPIIEQLRSYMNQHYNPIELWNHYQGLAKGNYRRWLIEGRERTIKKNLTIIRGCLHGEYIRQTHDFPEMDFPSFLETCPESILDDWDTERIQTLVKEKQDGNGNREIGNPFSEQIEEFIETEINPRDHLRDPHEFSEEESERYGSYQHGEIPVEEFPPSGHTCWPPHCDGHTSGHQLDQYMRQLLQSRTLFQ